MNAESEYVGVGEAARLLDVHENTIRNWVKTGLLPSSRIPGARQHRFLRSEVDRLLRDQGADVSSRVDSLKAFGPELVDANDLDRWRGRFAQERFPELIRRLLANTVGIANVSVRAGDGVSAPGYDGIATNTSTASFLPLGSLIMEMGTDADPAEKAKSDYSKRVSELHGTTSRSHFVFLTPRRWRNASGWQQKMTDQGHFASVRVLDADDLEGWLTETPLVHIWLSELLGRKPAEAETIERRWGEFAATTNPTLPLDLFTAGREEAVERVRTFLEGGIPDMHVMRIRAPWRDEIIGFLAAVAASIPDVSVVLIHSRETWGRVLTTSKMPMVVVPLFAGANLALAEEMKHRVIIPMTAQDSLRIDEDAIELPRISVEEASRALQQVNIEQNRASQLASLARRSMRAFVRSLARDERGLVPPWARAEDKDSRAIANLVLAQQWTDRDDDQAALTRLTNATPDDLEALLARWERHEDPPFIRSGSAWRVAAPVDAAFALLPLLTSSDLARWADLVVEVLTEPDPTADMTEAERLLAPFSGVRRKYSSILREGIAEGLALVGQTATVGVRNEAGGAIASQIVRKLLELPDVDQEAKAWRNLAPYLQSIAEGAPETFLEFVEQDLQRERPVLQGLFDVEDRESGYFGRTSPHVYLLWALEALARSADHFYGAANALSRLTTFDVVLGNTSNRASESLRVLLLPWIRQTSAPLPVRVSFLRSWMNKDDPNAWAVSLKLLPGGHDFALAPASPKYRDWSPQKQSVPFAEWSEFVDQLAKIVLRSAGTDLDKWAELVKPLPALPAKLREEFLGALLAAVRADVSGGPAQEQDQLYDALREVIGRHRDHPDADWALGEDDLSKLQEVLSLLSPSAPASQFGYLFSWHPRLDGFARYASGTGDRAAYEHELELLRREALRATAESGPESLRDLIRAVEAPQFLGMVLADDLHLVPLESVLQWLDEVGTNVGRAASAYVHRRSERGGVEWVIEVLHSALPETTKAIFAASLTPRPAIWALLEQDGHRAAHWAKLDPYAVPAESRRDAIAGLIEVGRAEDTLSLIELCISHEPRQILEPSLIIGAITALLHEERTAPMQSLSSYALSQILHHLRAQGVPDETLAPLEYALFRVLDDSEHGTPSLFRALEANPENFAHLVETAFRAKGPARGSETESKNPGQAALAYEVLMEWRIVPGTRDDGSVDGDFLKRWVENARLLLSESDRADIGDEMIGQLLSAGGSFAPEGWPASGVADVIEATASVAMESGLHVGLANGRGVSVRDPLDGGKQERDLATRFMRLAAVNQGWIRTSRVLKSVGEQYERQAQEEDRKSQWLGDGG